MNYEQILKTFDLTPVDAIMIPIGGLLFFVLYKFLSYHVFLPFLALTEAREQATVGADHAAIEITKKAAELSSEYELELRSSRARVMEERDRVVNKAKKEAAEILEKARAEAEEHVRDSRWQMASSLDELRKNSLNEADKLVDAVIEKVKAPRSQPSSGMH